MPLGLSNGAQGCCGTRIRTKADHFFDRGEMDLAQDEYVNLTREYPAGRFVRLAMLRSAEAAGAAFPFFMSRPPGAAPSGPGVYHSQAFRNDDLASFIWPSAK